MTGKNPEASPSQVLVNDMLQARPDLTHAEAERAVQHLMATAPQDHALTATNFRRASFETLGGALYAQASLRQADDTSRPVVVQLFSGCVIEGTVEQLLEQLKATPWRTHYDVSEVSRTWMNRQLTLVFEGRAESVPLGVSLSINFATFAKDARWNPSELQALCSELRNANVKLVTAPAGSYD
jgi:hypothetical protein